MTIKGLLAIEIAENYGMDDAVREALYYVSPEEALADYDLLTQENFDKLKHITMSDIERLKSKYKKKSK